MNNRNPIDPQVLDRILLLQTMLHVADDVGKLAELCCSSLASIPAVHAVAMIVDDQVKTAYAGEFTIPTETWHEVTATRKVIPFDVKSLEHTYGILCFAVDSPDIFAHYQPYVRNTANLAALVQDIWRRDRDLESMNRSLEELVRRRTHSLEESEARARTLIDHAPEAIVVFDMEGNRFVQANNNAAKLFGTTEENILASSVTDFSPEFQPCGGASSDLARKYLNEAMNGGTPVFEWTHLKADGTPVLCEVRLVRLQAAGEVLVRGSMTDIRRRRELEEQVLHRGKMEAVGQLSGGVAHDFNNLLVTIIGNAELLMYSNPDLDDANQTMIREILTAAERGASLSQRLLSFSCKQSLRPQRVVLPDVVENMVEILTRTLGENIKVSINNPGDLWCVIIDRGQLENAILNLALNARDAMTDGGSLAIATRNETVASGSSETEFLEAGDYVVLTVQDNGTGIKPMYMGRVTEPFFTTKEVGKGTGLGLSMVYGFAKQSGGHLFIESTLGEGTTVSLFLPRLSQDVSESQEEGDSPVVPRTIEAARILVVEDDRSVQYLIKKQLNKMGYEVECADDAAQGSGLLETSPEFDLLLTDVMLPGELSGPAFAKIAKSKCPNLRILFASGYAEDHFEDADDDLQPIQLIAKPFRYAELESRVHEILARD